MLMVRLKVRSFTFQRTVKIERYMATEYVTQMKKLITEERTRLERLKESMHGVC